MVVRDQVEYAVLPVRERCAVELEQVRSAAAPQNVGARATVQGIVAGTAIQNVRPAVARQIVAKIGTGEILDADETIVGRIAAASARLKVDRHALGRRRS